MKLSGKDKLKYRRLIKEHTRLDTQTRCWVWTGYRDPAGYGVIKRVPLGRKRAHRLAYAAFNGSPVGLLVRHTCDNPSCVNPKHLLLGTNADNIRDRVLRGRSKGGRTPRYVNPRVLRMLYDLGYSQARIASMVGLAKNVVWTRLQRLKVIY